MKAALTLSVALFVSVAAAQTVKVNVDLVNVLFTVTDSIEVDAELERFLLRVDFQNLTASYDTDAIALLRRDNCGK